MALASTAQIHPLSDQLLMTTGLSIAGVPVSSATVTFTLCTEFGVAIAGITNISALPVAGTPGAYNATLPSTLTPLSGSYILKISAVNGGSHYYTEQTVIVPFMQGSSNLMVGALCSVPALKAWGKFSANTVSGVNQDQMDVLYAQCINRFTEFANNTCNRSSFLTSSYVEKMNGNGKYYCSPKFAFPTNEIISVASVYINGLSIPAAPDTVTSGYVWSDYTVYLRGYTLTKGIQNVIINYTAGLASIPLELEQAALDACAFWIKKREFMGLTSVSSGGQTITYDKADMLATTARVLSQYTRRR